MTFWDFVSFFAIIKLDKNMTKIDLEKYQKIYPSLPEEIKKILDDPKFGEEIFNFCEEQKISQYAGEIVDELFLVLTGFLPPEDFRQKINSILPPEKAKTVFYFIFRTILYPILPAIEKLYAIKIEFKSTLPSSTEISKPKVTDKYREPIE